MNAMYDVQLNGKVSIIRINTHDEVVVKKFIRTGWLNDPDKVKYRGTRKSCFTRELRCLEALKNCQHFPQLIKADEANLILKMKYCGNHLDLQANNSHLLPQVKTIIDTLKKKKILIDHNSSPVKTAEEKYLNLAKLHNSLLEKGGKLYFIDFETCISFPLMKAEILPKLLIEVCQNCNYDYLASNIESYLKGEQSEILRKYLTQEKIHRKIP